MITRIRGRGELELRSFSLTDMVKWGYDGLRNVGASPSPKSVRGVPAIHRAARIKAEALAGLRLRCWRGDGPDRERADNVWQAKLFERPANPYQSRYHFWESVGESLAYRNNAYIWKLLDPEAMQVIEWYALHPDQVSCKGPDEYEVRTGGGFIDPIGRGDKVYRLRSRDILHIRGHGDGGMYEAPSPIQVFREALTSPLERQRHEARMWRKGTSLQLGVRFPIGVSKEQADEWRQTWRETYEGSNGDTTAVVGGGADLIPIGMTARDAEYVNLAHLTVEDASRIMGVPSELLELQINQVSESYEAVLARFYTFGLEPDLRRIESALEADQELFGLARTQPGFESEGVVRGDLATEDMIAHQQIQDGRLLVDEWRRSKGLDPLPGGVGMVPQVTPVGGAPMKPLPVPSANGNGDGS